MYLLFSIDVEAIRIAICCSALGYIAMLACRYIKK